MHTSEDKKRDRETPLGQKFDKIASIEMAEHVGIANFVDPYLTTVRKLLKRPDSSFLLQVSGLRQGANWQDVAWGLFMSKYIFPGADASTPLHWLVSSRVFAFVPFLSIVLHPSRSLLLLLFCYLSSLQAAALVYDEHASRYVKQCEMAGFEVHSVETIGRHYAHTLHKWYDTWMTYKDDILGGKIDAISHHTQGKHLFRLQEFFLAWSVVAAGQASLVE